jgi:Spy/CpxP family protein refolding chaperone
MSFGIDATSLLSSQYPNSTTGGTGGLRQFAGLNLSEQQRTQMRSILQNAKSQGTSQADVQQQLEGVLTPDQQAQFTAAQTGQTTPSTQSSQSTPGLFANLNLTADQQTKIDSILADAKTNGTSSTDVKSQIDAVLTDSQKTQLAANVQNARASGSGHHRHHGGGGGADSTSSTSAASTTASTTSASGVTESDLQNQALAALSVLTKYVESQVTTG